jgi:hypothetical protein
MAQTRPPCNELLKWLRPYDLEVAELALAARRVVLAAAPTASEIVFDAGYTIALHYTFTGRVKEAFSYVAIYTHHVNLGFTYGAELKDPKGLLLGDGTQMRHLRVETLEDLDRPHVPRFLRAAIRHIQPATAKVERRPAEPITVVKVAMKKNRPRRDG